MNKKIALLFAQCARQAASADNSQPWLFSWDGSRFSISYDTRRVRGNTFPPLNPATLLAIGGCIENIEQYAQANKLLILCDYTFSESADNFEFVRISLQHPLDAVDPFPAPTFCRHTNRHPFYQTPVPAGVMNLIQTWHRGSSRIRSYTHATERSAWRQLVHSASEIRFQTQEVHEWLGKSLRFGSHKNAQDGLDIRTLALPPGGGLLLRLISDWKRMTLLNKAGLYKVLSSVDSAPLAKAPALIAIIGGSIASEVVESGKLLNAVWTELNRQGLAVHPYYVVPDLLYRLRQDQIPEKLKQQAKSVATAADKLLSLAEGETLHMLLRVGSPAKRYRPSQRLPLDVVFTDVSVAGERRMD